MTAVNNEWVNDLARRFNDSQKDYKVVPSYKGSYDESMAAAIAAFRAGNAPNILQVFEVGTATMMASKGAIVPVAKVMKDAGEKFDPSDYVSAVGQLRAGARDRRRGTRTGLERQKDGQRGAGRDCDARQRTARALSESQQGLTRAE